MKIQVFDQYGEKHQLIVKNVKTEIIPDSCFMDGEYLNIFTNSHRVQDVWRYTVISSKGKVLKHHLQKSELLPHSNFSDRLAQEAIGTRVILLILESPHISEYNTELVPKGPAQGQNVADAGGAIEKYLELVLAKVQLPDGYFSFLIANPIPYMCSLGKFFSKLNSKVRDEVWSTIWCIPEIKKDFISRIVMYQPEFILNCCTSALQAEVSNIIKEYVLPGQLYEGQHPAVQWNIYQDNTKLEKIC